jgi:AsmA-like C-terminal region
LALAPLRVTKLDATAAIDGRSVRLTRTQADFYGGRISGDFGAVVSAEPAYSFRGQVERVNAALLTEASPWLAGQFAGLVSGELKLAAKGIGRQALLSSFQGDGMLRSRDAVVPVVNAAWGDLGEADVPQAAGVRRFATGTVAFRVSDGSIHLDSLRLADRDRGFEVTGAVDFSRKLNLRVRPLQLLHGVEAPSAHGVEADAWVVGGTLEAPEVSPKTNVAGNAAGVRR